MFNKSQIQLKTPEQFAIMRKAGRVVALCLAEINSAIKPGMTTLELDLIARKVMEKEGAQPSFLGYHGYPAVICVSINEEVVHGIPDEKRFINDGDLVSVDCGAIIDGWHGDAALTVLVGDVAADLRELSRVTEASLWAGLRAARPGNRLSDIGHAVESVVRAAGDQYGIIEEYVGHGIGSSMHMEPAVPNYGRPGKGPRLVPGMALAVEPMVVLGDPGVHVLDDDWTVVASDGSHASHWEHTVAVTEDGPWVLTALDDVRL
jgi:methionyl aminopeptidase